MHLLSRFRVDIVQHHIAPKSAGNQRGGVSNFLDHFVIGLRNQLIYPIGYRRLRPIGVTGKGIDFSPQRDAPLCRIQQIDLSPREKKPLLDPMRSAGNIGPISQPKRCYRLVDQG